MICIHVPINNSLYSRSQWKYVTIFKYVETASAALTKVHKYQNVYINIVPKNIKVSVCSCFFSEVYKNVSCFVDI